MRAGGQAVDLAALAVRQVGSSNATGIVTSINPSDDSVFLHVSPAESQAIVAGLVYFSLWLGALGWDVVSTLGFDLMLVRNTNWRSIPSGIHSIAYMLSRYLNVAWICMAVTTPIVRSNDCHIRAITSATLFALGLAATTLVFLLRTAAIWRLKPIVVIPLTISWIAVLALSVTLPINLNGVQLGGEWCTLDVSHITALGVVACVFVFDSLCLFLTVLRLNRTGWRGLLRGLLPGMWLSSRRKQEEAYGEPEPSEDSVAVMLVERTVAFFSIQFVILISAVAVYYATEQVAFRLMQIVACQAISAIMAGRLFRRAWFLTRQQQRAIARQIAQPSPPSYSARYLEDDVSFKFDEVALAAGGAMSPSLIRPSAVESSSLPPGAAMGSGIGDAPISNVARRKSSKAALTAAALADEDLYVEGEFPKTGSTRSLLLPKDSYTSIGTTSAAQRYAARHARERRSSGDEPDDVSIFVPMDGTLLSAHRRQTLPATLRPSRSAKVSRQTIEDATKWPVGPSNYAGWWKTGGSAHEVRAVSSGRRSTDTSQSIYEVPRRPVTSHTSSSRSSSSRNQVAHTPSAAPSIFEITRQVQPSVGRASAGPEVLRDALATRESVAVPPLAATPGRRRRPATAPSQRDDLNQRPKRSILFIDSARARRGNFVANDHELAEFPLRPPRTESGRDFVASPSILGAGRISTPRDRSAYDLDALKAAASLDDRSRYEDAGLGSAPPSMITFGASPESTTRRNIATFADGPAFVRDVPAVSSSSNERRRERSALFGVEAGTATTTPAPAPPTSTEVHDALFAFRQTIDDDAAELSREISRPHTREESKQRTQSSAETDDDRPRTSRGGPLSAFGQPRIGTADSTVSRNDGRPTTSHGRPDEMPRPLTGHGKHGSSTSGRFQRIPLESQSNSDLRGQAQDVATRCALSDEPEQQKSAIAEQFERLAAAAARPSADFEALRSSGSGEHEPRSAVQKLSGLRPKLDRVSSDNVIESLDC
ncbi:hypothetical protein CBOM_04494 [Ceraceosorus bombacis]|uniref:Uncharacterized protein n=1 Tax=Ceraceosorus bombacis TaxID=401625 RepID=A0A0P1BPY9_9BASI|nr:hypothetical protein CBOM_04494 [Ceraceosorus bombacis]